MDAIPYKNGQKNQWRRTAWNAIERLVDNPPDAIVLYLPGSTDLDRPEALRRNFKPANLIAVERDPKVVAHLRAKGTTVVCGGLLDVLRSWPETRKVGVVVADFQSGYQFCIGEIVQRLARFHPAFSGCVFMVNLQRGRDEPENIDPEYFEMLTKYGVLDATAMLRLGAEAKKHRGLMLMFNFHQEFKSIQELNTQQSILMLDTAKFFKTKADEQDTVDPEKAYKLLELAIKYAEKGRKAIFSNGGFVAIPLPPYRSTARSPRFDGIVFKVPGWSDDSYSPWKEIAGEPQRELQRVINAALAIRTRRLRGELRRAA
jgi:hypothetical protein